MNKKLYISFLLTILCVLFIDVGFVSANGVVDKYNNEVYPKAAYIKGVTPPFSSKSYAQDNTNPATGSLNLRYTDLVLKGKNGFDFSLTRYYDLFSAKTYEIYAYEQNTSIYENRRYLTYNDKRYNLGAGWAFDIPTVEKGNDGWPCLHYGSAGVWQAIGYDSANQCYYFADYNLQDFVLRCDYDQIYNNGQYYDTYILEQKDGITLYFTIDGLLIGEKDRFGNEIKYFYTDRVLYDNASGTNNNYPLLSKVVDSVGREITFNYSTNSLTVQVSDGATTKSIVYNKARIVDKLGNNMSNIINDDEYVLDNVVDIGQKTTYYNYEYKSTKESFLNRSITDTLVDGIGVDNVAVCLSKITYPTGLITSNITYKYTKNCGDTGCMTFYKVYNTMDTYKTGGRQKTYMCRRDGSNEFDGYPNASPNGTITEVVDGLGDFEKYTYNADLLCTSLLKTGKDHKEEITTEFSNQMPNKTIHRIYNKTTGNCITNVENYSYNNYRDLEGYWDSQNDRDENNVPTNNEHKTTYLYDSKYHYIVSKSYKMNAATTIEEINQPSADQKTIEYHKIKENGTLKKQTQYLYDTNGNVTEERDFLSDWVNYIATKYSYDDNVSSRSGKFNGLCLTRKYTENVKDADGTLVAAKTGNSAGIVDEVYMYDWFGNLTDKYDGVGNHTHNDYDLLNRVTNVTLPDNNHMSYVYTVSNTENSVLYTNEKGTQLKYLYDEYGNLINEQDVLSGQYLKTYTYDNEFRILTESNHNNSSNSYKTTYNYYSDGKIKNKDISDKKGNTLSSESYTYDNAYTDASNGKVYLKTSRQIFNAPYITINTYTNKHGQVEKQEKEHYIGNNTTKKYTDTFRYDYLGNKTDVKTARAYDEAWTQPYTTHYDYDYNGNVIKTTDINGKYLTTEYDALGRVSKVTDAMGNQCNPTYSTTYTYDNVGRLIIESIPFNKDGSGQIFYTTKKHYYDRNNNVISEQISANIPGQANKYNRTDYEYNSRNFLMKVTTFNNGTAENYTQYYYDAAGNKLRMYTGLSSPLAVNGLDSIIPGSDSNYITTKYEYNRFGKLIKRVDNTQPTGKEENYTYDINGNLEQEVDRNGDTIAYTFDGMGRTLTRSVSTPTGTGNATYSYTYKYLGDKNSMSGGGIDVTYDYDDLGRLITETQSDNIVKSYTYDADNNRKSLIVKQNGTVIESTTYEYDNMNRLYKVYENGQLAATYAYNDNGSRDTLAYSNGVNSKYSYNLANKLLSLSSKNSSGTVISQYAYTYYLDGNQASKTDTTVGKTTSYEYDGLGRLKTENEGGGQNASYEYDDSNNRKTMTIAGGAATSYIYDSNNRLITETKADGNTTNTTRYTYDDNGNQIYKWTDVVKPAVAGETASLAAIASGEGNSDVTISEYDGFNQLVKTTAGDNAISYAYNGDGLRASKTVNGTITKQVWDGDQVVLEMDGSGSVKNKYIRGINLIYADNGTSSRYYLFNGHGDVTGLTDTTGNVVKSYEYDAFGNEKNPDANDTNMFRYCGEYFDKETGTIYLRARYYDPEIGRFVSEDSNLGKDRDPLSLNLYTYCWNNPVNLVDATGNWPSFVMDPLKQLNNALNYLKNLWAWRNKAEAKAEIQLREAAAERVRKLCPGIDENSDFFKQQVALTYADMTFMPIGGMSSSAKETSNIIKSLVSKIDVQDMSGSIRMITSNTTLQNIIKELFKGMGNANIIGNGTTMDAIRNEILTGQATNGVYHFEKGWQYMQGLTNLLRQNLSSADKNIVQALINDLKNALATKR